jgi:hypothetical protein
MLLVEVDPGDVPGWIGGERGGVVLTRHVGYVMMRGGVVLLVVVVVLRWCHVADGVVVVVVNPGDVSW